MDKPCMRKLAAWIKASFLLTNSLNQVCHFGPSKLFVDMKLLGQFGPSKLFAGKKNPEILHGHVGPGKLFANKNPELPLGQFGPREQSVLAGAKELPWINVAILRLDSNGTEFPQSYCSSKWICGIL